MKSFLKIGLTVSILGGGGLLTSFSAQAAAMLDTTTATPDDGILQNFTGIDWHSNGAGWVQGFDLDDTNLAGDTDTFTLTYQAFAASINTTSPTPNLSVAPPGPGGGSYELTTYAVITETATCNNDGCSSITITLDSGTWDIFFDTSPDTDQAAGTGFLNGTNILSGTWDSGFTTFGATAPIPGGTGTGGGFLVGTVTSTNNSFVNPDLVGTELQASLQFPGQSAPDYTRPAAFGGAATGADTSTDFVLQTDTSQNFSVSVPEPNSVALVAIGLLGLSGLTRRRAKQSNR
ncbi:protein of unknown function DUF1555 [Nitrosococcus halophilus Nc 4]|uniref:Ice-binding protein C-terminal domain-containing protein n=1 Tax=Nitrosococcus halophilus (strain Nc4) TaxID=472759 RepID=D5C049_NITHN|nr:flocculation-associated PEP-CTERM protein PepA [Nitrosococcus halophilus]ADE16296.1 protein of unknown function DUF1555 [Nitrosococcus halophilus Nc 4]